MNLIVIIGIFYKKIIKLIIIFININDLMTRN